MCEEYAASHGLLYNVKKSEIMIFRVGSKCPTYIPAVKNNGVTLQRMHRFKLLLRHLLTEYLGDDADMERDRKALSVRANMLITGWFARCCSKRTVHGEPVRRRKERKKERIVIQIQASYSIIKL